MFLPYCLERQPDGSYVVQNRAYKPVGMTRESFVRYKEFPVRVRIKGLTPLRISKISWRGDESPEAIYLYDDGSVPTDSAANWDAYCARLEVLAKLDVEAVDDPTRTYDGPLKG